MISLYFRESTIEKNHSRANPGTMSTKSKLGEMVAFYRFGIWSSEDVNIVLAISILIGLGWHSLADISPHFFAPLAGLYKVKVDDTTTKSRLPTVHCFMDYFFYKFHQVFLKERKSLSICVCRRVQVFVYVSVCVRCLFMLSLNPSTLWTKGIPSILLVSSNKISKGHYIWSWQTAALIKPLGVPK